MNYKYSKSIIMCRPGFSLTELMISIAMISVISVAVGLAMYQSRSRIESVKYSLAALQKLNDALKIISDDLRWADHVSIAGNCQIDFSAPDNPGDLISIYWNSGNRNLYRTCDGINPIVILDQVTNFTMEYDIISLKGVTCIRGLTVIVNSSASEGNDVRKYISLLNQPQAP